MKDAMLQIQELELRHPSEGVGVLNLNIKAGEGVVVLSFSSHLVPMLECDLATIHRSSALLAGLRCCSLRVLARA